MHMAVQVCSHHLRMFLFEMFSQSITNVRHSLSDACEVLLLKRLMLLPLLPPYESQHFHAISEIYRITQMQ